MELLLDFFVLTLVKVGVCLSKWACGRAFDGTTGAAALNVRFLL